MLFRSVRVADLKYWDRNWVDPGGQPNGGWVPPSGQFQVLVTGSADPNDSNRLTATFTVQ